MRKYVDKRKKVNNGVVQYKSLYTISVSAARRHKSDEDNIPALARNITASAGTTFLYLVCLFVTVQDILLCYQHERRKAPPWSSQQLRTGFDLIKFDVRKKYNESSVGTAGQSRRKQQRLLSQLIAIIKREICCCRRWLVSNTVQQKTNYSFLQVCKSFLTS